MKEKTIQQKYYYASEEKKQLTDKKKQKIKDEAKLASTIKKIPQKKFQRNHPLQNQYLSFLEDQKDESMMHSFYSEAEIKESLINKIKKDFKKKKIKSLSLHHLSEKESIKAAHMRQMEGFKRAWKDIFDQIKLYEAKKLSQFQQIRFFEIQKTKSQVLRRCKTVKPSIQIMQLKQLEREQSGFRKQGRYRELKIIRSEKKKKRKQYKKQSESICKRIVEDEERKLSQNQARRYRSFVDRIDGMRKDKILQYRREQERLKHKYNNILNNLIHQQKRQINSIISILN